MNSRYGLMVAVAVVFAGVITAYAGRAYGHRQAMAMVCGELEDGYVAAKASKNAKSEDERAAALGILKGLHEVNCR